MYLIVGLGNPGLEYANTRHNLGFWAVDTLVLGLKKAGELIEKNKFDSLIFENHKMILAMPETFMNNSGLAVKKLLAAYKIKPEDLIVIQDEIDIPIGSLKLSFDASAGGHNGVKSIIDQVGTQKFIRLRLGIKPDGVRKLATDQFVLRKFNIKEKNLAKTMVEQVPEIIETVLTEGLPKAMSLYN